MNLADIKNWSATLKGVSNGLMIRAYGIGNHIVYALRGKAYSEPGKSEASHCVAATVQAVSGSGASCFGIATEAWSMVDPDAKPCHLINEVSLISQRPERTGHRKRGLDVVFKNRPDTHRWGKVRLSRGDNGYNMYANAIVISSQARSDEGEYCGWNAAIRLGPHCLDRTVHQPFSAIVDYRSCGTDGNGDIPYRYVWEHAGKQWGERLNPQTLALEIWRDINTNNPRLVKST